MMSYEYTVYVKAWIACNTVAKNFFGVASQQLVPKLRRHGRRKKVVDFSLTSASMELDYYIETVKWYLYSGIICAVIVAVMLVIT